MYLASDDENVRPAILEAPRKQTCAWPHAAARVHFTPHVEHGEAHKDSNRAASNASVCPGKKLPGPAERSEPGMDVVTRARRGPHGCTHTAAGPAPLCSQHAMVGLYFTAMAVGTAWYLAPDAPLILTGNVILRQRGSEILSEDEPHREATQNTRVNNGPKAGHLSNIKREKVSGGDSQGHMDTRRWWRPLYRQYCPEAGSRGLLRQTLSPGPRATQGYSFPHPKLLMRPCSTWGTSCGVDRLEGSSDGGTLGNSISDPLPPGYRMSRLCEDRPWPALSHPPLVPSERGRAAAQDWSLSEGLPDTAHAHRASLSTPRSKPREDTQEQVTWDGGHKDHPVFGTAEVWFLS